MVKKGVILLLIKKEIIGKEVVDTSGIVIGKVDDVEVNFETQTMEGIMVSQGGFLEVLEGPVVVP